MKLLFNNYNKPNSKFAGLDSKELFENNLKKMPADWMWRHTNVKYTINSQLYRCPEFEIIDWNNSILMLGCSHTFGIGLDDSQTCSKHLSDLIQIPVINLGQGGASVMFQWANTCRLIENNINPKCVIYFWPDATRTLEFKDEPDVYHHGNWSLPNSRWAESWIIHPTHSTEFLRYAKISVSHMWNCPVLHYTHTKKDFEKNKDLKFLPRVPGDHARDWNSELGRAHPGPKTNRLWAEIIAQDIGNVA
jgi:hypothetical protein